MKKVNIYTNIERTDVKPYLDALVTTGVSPQAIRGLNTGIFGTKVPETLIDGSPDIIIIEEPGKSIDYYSSIIEAVARTLYFGNTPEPEILEAMDSQTRKKLYFASEGVFPGFFELRSLIRDSDESEMVTSIDMLMPLTEKAVVKALSRVNSVIDISGSMNDQYQLGTRKSLIQQKPGVLGEEMEVELDFSIVVFAADTFQDSNLNSVNVRLRFIDPDLHIGGWYISCVIGSVPFCSPNMMSYPKCRINVQNDFRGDTVTVKPFGKDWSRRSIHEQSMLQGVIGDFASMSRGELAGNLLDGNRLLRLSKMATRLVKESELV